jgi:hypothetical protein
MYEDECLSFGGFKNADVKDGFKESDMWYKMNETKNKIKKSLGKFLKIEYLLKRHNKR